MDDQQVLDRIDKLVQEEEALLHRHEGEGLDDDEHARLQELQVQLDKAYDYLRQRRALRHSGQNPDDASMRDGGTVETYEQ
ncbi:MAG TPA: DUF2630 family protein [Solirubrobacterales bacterium]|jgi:hypothetical protein|nr:DUF2630 family protein [Solirubrobacterales bacterium]